MKRTGLSILIAFIFLTLTGCLYPESEKLKNSGPIDVHIDSVEVALKRYHQDTGVYPIKNSTVDTPIYEKYIIDMGRLYPRYLGYLPPNSFENGGSHMYVVVDIEQTPRVRLIDLKSSSEVERVQRSVNQYYHKNGQYPFGEMVAPSYYKIDYKRLDISAPTIISPFSDKALPLIISDQGEVFIDYMLDIGIFLNQGFTSEHDDPRQVLVDHSYFVPVKSPTYHYEDGEVVLGNKME